MKQMITIKKTLCAMLIRIHTEYYYCSSSFSSYHYHKNINEYNDEGNGNIRNDSVEVFCALTQPATTKIKIGIIT